jgi:inosine/xanthosine triphosphatase
MMPGENFEFFGVDVFSGVSNQPMTDEETIYGARTRAKAALKKFDVDYGVGLEGGLQAIEGKYVECGWMVVLDRDNKEGIGASPKVEIAPAIMRLIHEGKELGHAVDQIFKLKNAKQGAGYFGTITKNTITRTSGYRDGVIMALAPFVHKDLFNNV